MWTLIFYHTENNLSNFCVTVSEKKKVTFRFQSLEIILLQRETDNCLVEVKLWTKTCFSEKTYLYEYFCLNGSYQSIYDNERKWGIHIQDAKHLAEELQKYPCFYEKWNEVYTERPGGKCLGNSGAAFNSIFINNKRPSHTLKYCTFFVITFAKKSITQITWNTILYHWRASPAINYGKILAQFFFKMFSLPTSFSFFFWSAPDDSLRENNKPLNSF